MLASLTQAGILKSKRFVNTVWADRQKGTR